VLAKEDIVRIARMFRPDLDAAEWEKIWEKNDQEEMVPQKQQKKR
jgi:hypothetical protein